MRRVVTALVAVVLICAAVGAGADNRHNPFVKRSDPHGILDFRRPPSVLDTARLVVFDGTNVNAPVTRSSFWVSPGQHTMVVSAAISKQDSVGFTPRRHRGTGSSQEVTIVVEEGMRYKIAARLLDRKGNWEPVIWQVEPLKD